MCGRYAQDLTPREIAEAFRATLAELDAEFMATHPRYNRPQPPVYNIAPTDPITIVDRDDHGERRVRPAWWDFVPSTSGGPRDRPWFNARDDKVGSSHGVGSIYRSALKRNRCLIPFRAFYEWQAIEGRPRKQPWAIRPVAGEPPYAFAGISSSWIQPDGKVLDGVAIFTTSANQLMAWIHNSKARQPVILHREQQDAWLDPSLEDPTEAAKFLTPLPDGEVEAWPVRPAVGRWQEDSEALLAATGETIREPRSDEGRTGLFG
ncbi:SOS response-associated peptidase [Mucisphaera sp.]|uniref:SOS response-associated peptidase n=1 Tax=Mucisphaera sp. TaxID=2913024 RepID=UPI003D095EF3